MFKTGVLLVLKYTFDKFAMCEYIKSYNTVLELYKQFVIFVFSCSLMQLLPNIG